MSADFKEGAGQPLREQFRRRTHWVEPKRRMEFGSGRELQEEVNTHTYTHTHGCQSVRLVRARSYGRGGCKESKIPDTGVEVYKPQ